MDEKKHHAIVTPINILKGGRIDKQPDDFFDQTEKDLSCLLGF
jgi:predicted ATPase